MQYKAKLKRVENDPPSFETSFTTFMFASSHIYDIGFVSNDNYYLACCPQCAYIRKNNSLWMGGWSIGSLDRTWPMVFILAKL